MIIADNNKISIVRGDSGSVEITVNAIVSDEEVEYELEAGDTLTFRMSKSFDGEPLIEKDITDGTLGFDPADTADLPFGDYYYDVTLESDGLTDHVIQADRNDPNFFILEAVPYGTES